jgi:hypothetical protein
MALALAVWLACTAGGFLLIDLDVGRKLVTLTMGHGLTVVDAAGAALLVAGWLAAAGTARQRFGTRRTRPSQGVVIALVVGVLGACVLAASTFVEDFAGRKFVVAALVLVGEVAAAAVALPIRRRVES